MRSIVLLVWCLFYYNQLTFHVVDSETLYRVCAREGNSQDCQALERGSSNVVCTKVTDSIDCLLKINEGKADFGMMSTEELILASIVKSDKFDVVASVRHQDRRQQRFAFQSVVLVKADHTGGVSGLKTGKLCHPGYGKAKEQLWSDRVLKYFERKTAGGNVKCDAKSKSSAEDEAANLSNFFSDACRPGPWVVDPVEDKRLKDRFPSLCSLCTSNRSPDCNGYRYFEPKTSPGMGVNSHLSAIECLTSGKGTVAYVAYAHVQDYFKSNPTEITSYNLLCENGSMAALSIDGYNREAPCAWVHQPWGVILARKDNSKELLVEIKKWMPSGRSGGAIWVDSLDSILFKEKSDVLEFPLNVITPMDYITAGRPMPTAETSCHKALRWCTVNETEYEKCTWIKAASLTLGLQPEITCVQGSSHLDCLKKIKQEGADFISIDSNLGFIARKYYNVTAVLYHETSRLKQSKVYAVIKDSDKNTITRFENLKNKNACFPEYGGIGWVAFMRTAHERKVISPRECDYTANVVNFFDLSCAPGATDPAHYPTKSADPSKLCAGCRGFKPVGANEQGLVSRNSNPEKECPADFSNVYYGNRGALRCLHDVDSHVAFLEIQNIEGYTKFFAFDDKFFRVLCRNGSLAANPGFSVDDNCALSVTVDSEVVARRGDKNSMSLQLYLQELDACFGYNSRTSQLIDFEVFSPFNNTEDLLFKDSTIGLANADSDNEYVKEYVQLFKHTESCTGGAFKSVLSPLLMFAAILQLIVKYVS